MPASNPGQFSYNVVFYVGSATSPVTLKVSVPYPFVTQGAKPVHVYSGYAYSGGCFTPGSEVTSSFSVSPSTITLSTYGTSTATLGTTEVLVTLTGPVPASGIVFVTIHLDYGFKGSNGWSGAAKTTGTSAATCTSGGTCASLPEWVSGKKVDINPSYTFDFKIGDLEGTAPSVSSINAFKNDPGIAGLIVDKNNTPVAGVKVTISGPGVSATVYTDEDGWYQYVYKYTGKAATFTITASSTSPSWTQTKTVTLKSNGYIEVDFQRPI
jgi:hypothetical protein